MNDFPQTLTKNLTRMFVALIILVAILAFFFSLFNGAPRPSGNVSISQMIADAQKGKIVRIEIQRDDPHDLFITYRDQPRKLFYSRIDKDDTILKLLMAANVPLDTVDVQVAPPPA